ncbi:hypothetical protein SCOR_06015 [Sulfidibacter corallicola]|uniref:Cytochrome C n=1 Tax=Sulfidibacter corallicola TaxID=2818388 RepID=A0A8A4TR61_SULCO|nr:hypothetical protein [Sulfidibacter corallicola]QTD51674.1 hypothetical protein J3U87_04320 [Sulfidibacter corallicola]
MTVASSARHGGARDAHTKRRAYATTANEVDNRSHGLGNGRPCRQARRATVSRSPEQRQRAVATLVSEAEYMNVKWIGIWVVLAISICLNLLLINDKQTSLAYAPTPAHRFAGVYTTFEDLDTSDTESGKVTVRRRVAHTVPNAQEVLSTAMAALQTHSHKLELSLHNRNQRLADYYLKAMSRELARIRRSVGEHEGYPIAEWTSTMTEPHLGTLREDVQSQNWERAESVFVDMIKSCNQCHMRTEHGFIKIETTHPENPYNQRFE